MASPQAAFSRASSYILATPAWQYYLESLATPVPVCRLAVVVILNDVPLVRRRTIVMSPVCYVHVSSLVSGVPRVP